MTSKWVDERDLRFILHEVFNISEVILGKAPFEDHDKDMVNMVLDAAVKFAENEIAQLIPMKFIGSLWRQFSETAKFLRRKFTTDYGGYMLKVAGLV